MPLDSKFPYGRYDLTAGSQKSRNLRLIKTPRITPRRLPKKLIQYAVMIPQEAPASHPSQLQRLILIKRQFFFIPDQSNKFEECWISIKDPFIFYRFTLSKRLLSIRPDFTISSVKMLMQDINYLRSPQSFLCSPLFFSETECKQKKRNSDNSEQRN